MLRSCLKGAGVAAAAALLAAGCGSSGKPRPDLVFVSSRDGAYEIYGANADGSREQRLAKEKGDASSPRKLFFEIDPAWSPNGRRLVFDSTRDGPNHLFVMNADGTGIRRLTATAQQDTQPSWSPDGRKIVFAREGALFLVAPSGGTATRVGSGPGSAADPAWSPDGKWIAYDYRKPGGPVHELWIMRSDGSRPRQLTHLNDDTESPAWSPDSNRLTFSSNAQGSRFAIYTIGLDGKGLRRLTVTTDDSIEPAWSPDGTLIAYSRSGRIYTVDPAGKRERPLSNGGNDSSPAWRPKVPAATG